MNFTLSRSTRFLLLLIFFSGITAVLHAQSEIIIKGKVLDESSTEALIGAAVKVKGSTSGAITDVEGNFQLKTKEPVPFTLIVNYIGYQTREIIFYEEADEPVVIKIKPSNVLSEIVVVGYGEQKRKDVTGSVSSIPTELKAQPVASVERLLQGAVAGAVVTQTSGQPGGGVSVQIRGNNSITAGSDPLYVIDGYPINNDYGVNDAGVADGPKINPLSSLSTADIESIDVLKDASATAIYGSRGANGVVIITTKKGSRNESSVSYDGYTGVSSVIRFIPVLNAGEWWQLRKDAAINSGKLGVLLANNANLLKNAAAGGYTLDTAGTGTDWQKAAFHNGVVQNHNLSLFTGSEKTRLAISGNYFKQDGVLLNTDFIRYSGRVNLDHDYSKKFKISSSINASNTKAQVAPAAIVGNLLFTPPALPIYKADGTYVINSPFESSLANPINSLNNQLNETRTNRLLGSVAGDYKITDALTARVLAGIDVIDNKQNRYLPISTSEGQALGGSASVGSSFTTNWLNENTLNYTRDFYAIHRISVLGGFTAQHSETKGLVTSAAGFPSDVLLYNNIGVGVTTRPVGSFASEWALASWLGRINYSLKEKYLLTLTLRVDGSSRFGPDNKWGYFPSIAVAWNAHEEEFLKNNSKTLSNLKVRASIGNTGNQSIPPYSSLAQLASFRYNFSNTTVSSYAPNSINNPNLGWEQTTQADIGVDIGLFKNRVSIIADVYYKRTSDLLLNAPVSGTSGLSYYDPNGNPSQSSTVYQNIGRVENKGYELAVFSENLNGKFGWNTTLILSQNTNKVLELGPGINQIIPQISQPSVLQVGVPVGSFLVYVTDGLIKPNEAALTPQAQKGPGGQKYKDLNGDGKITQDYDRVVINNNPPFVIGLTNTFKFAGFDLAVFLQASIGGKLYNSNRGSLELGTGYINASKDFLKEWNGTNSDTKAPFQDPAITISDRFIEDATYGRLKNLSLGYTIPLKITSKAKIKSLRIYVSGQNLITWTNYTGFDPEVSFTGQSLINRGIDQGVYPNSKTILGGLSIGL